MDRALLPVCYVRRCDPEMTPAVTEVNSQITELAPVLNAPFADGYVTATGTGRR